MYIPCMQMCKSLRLIFFYNYLDHNILGYFDQSFKEELKDFNSCSPEFKKPATFLGVHLYNFQIIYRLQLSLFNIFVSYVMSP